MIIKKIFKISFIVFLFLLQSNFLFSQQLSDSVGSFIKLDLKPKENLDTNNFNVFPKKFNKKKVALVLSGGGARGLAQIGVLKAFEEKDIPIDMIVGTSIGSIVGGLYSSGYTPGELKGIVDSIDWENKFSLTGKYYRESLFFEQKKIQDKSLITISLDGLKPQLPSSLTSGQQLAELINVLVINSRYKPKRNFDDLRIPFTSVATDLDEGERIILRKGNLSECIKASITFPLLYTPTKINGRNLVDGGLIANIPVDVAKELGADIVIAVNSTSPLKTEEELKNPLNTADQIISITMKKLNEHQLKNADVIITPEIGKHSASDFNNIDFLIEQGKLSVNDAVDKIKKIIDSTEMSESKYFNNFIINPRVFIDSKLIPEQLKNKIITTEENELVRFTSIEKNLKELYKLGYFQNVFAIATRDEEGAKLIYRVEKNPIMKGLKISSGFSFLDSTVKDFESTNMGKVINHNSMLDFFENILGILKQNDFSAADVEKFYFNYNTGNLEIEITDGKINRIKLNGNNRTKDNVILREVILEENNIAYKKDIELSLKNIFSTNIFQQLSFDIVYNSSLNHPDLKIHVVEKSTRNFRFAIRIDNERNLQLLFDLRDENIFGSANEIGLNLNGGLRDREYKFEIKSNRFFNTFLTYNLSLFYKFRDIYDYSQTIIVEQNEYTRTRIGEYRNIKYGGSFLLGTQLERIGTIYSQIFIESLRIRGIEGKTYNERDVNVIKLKFGGRVDSQDKIPFPTRGSIINYFYETAQDKLGGTLSYSKLLIDFTQYISIGKHHNLGPSFIFGFADKTTPLQEQFSLGGEQSFFGMVEDELRGRQILKASLEYRYFLPYKLFFDTYFSVRYDLGRIWENAEDIRFKDLRHGIGLTVSFDTPLGEASFSVGKSLIINRGLKKDSFIFGPYTYYFSIGYEL